MTLREAFVSKKAKDMMVERAERCDENLPHGLENASELELQLKCVTAALGELYDLLEQYAPPWYTQEHHEKAKSALRETRLRKPIGKGKSA